MHAHSPSAGSAESTRAFGMHDAPSRGPDNCCQQQEATLPPKLLLTLPMPYTALMAL